MHHTHHSHHSPFRVLLSASQNAGNLRFPNYHGRDAAATCANCRETPAITGVSRTLSTQTCCGYGVRLVRRQHWVTFRIPFIFALSGSVLIQTLRPRNTCVLACWSARTIVAHPSRFDFDRNPEYDSGPIHGSVRYVSALNIHNDTYEAVHDVTWATST